MRELRDPARLSASRTNLRDNSRVPASRGMHRFLVQLLLVFLLTGSSHADSTTDRAAIVDALTKLASYADSVARAAQRSDDRGVRKNFAPRALDVADDLEALANRARKDVGYRSLGKDALDIDRDALALVELADEAQDKTERKTLRAQAVTLEQSIATTHKVLEALAARDDDKQARPQKPQPMKSAEFGQLVAAIRGASFDDDKVGVVRLAAQNNWFLASQGAAVMDLISFDDGKIDAAAAMWPRITDPENYFVMMNKLSFDSSKDKLRKRVGR
jgi:hypothetical protein